MPLGDVDGGLEGRRYGPVDGKETYEGPEKQTKVYENTDPNDVEPPNRLTVIDPTVENRKVQLSAPLAFFDCGAIFNRDLLSLTYTRKCSFIRVFYGQGA
jgi:hypothetical protein